MSRRLKSNFKKAEKTKKLIGILMVTSVTVGVALNVYISHNKNKSSLAYAGVKGESKNVNSSGTSSGFTPNIKNKEDKGSKKSIDINENHETSKNSTDRKKVVDPSEPTTPIEPNSNKNSVESEKTTESSKTKNYKEFFKNDVFLGDSISESLTYYEFLEEKNVCAKKGININNAKNEVEKISIKNPKNIYILYGVNDMDNTVASKWFIDNYRTLIHKVKEKFPNTNIYVQSVLPVLPIVEQKRPTMTNSYINECNSGLIQLVREENVNFLNIKSILNESNKNLYEDDGIHFKPNFYIKWLNYVADKA